MGALKPRGVMGPIDAARENRSVVVRVPLDQLGESLVLVLDNQEAQELGTALQEATS